MRVQDLNFVGETNCMASFTAFAPPREMGGRQPDESGEVNINCGQFKSYVLKKIQQFETSHSTVGIRKTNVNQEEFFGPI